LLGLVPLAWALVLAVYARRLSALWREPVWRVPVLVFESDDWGAGPLTQAAALTALQAVLQAHHDAAGRPAQMTLGVVLALVDTEAMRADTQGTYHAIALDDARLAPVLEVLRAGIAAGVFTPQLHGMAHYWPPAVLAAARSDAGVRAWLTGSALPRTEDLPSALQSRWTDARTLPSQPLSEADINAAAAQEAATFARIFGQPARVAVPTTFVWNDAVERAWAAHGVRCIVTPGTRYDQRDALGQPTGDARHLLNHQRGQGAIRYLVRDQYFEPALGHDAARGLAALARQTLLGRPTLLETHRFNFVGAAQAASLRALNALLTQARAAYSGVQFLSSWELAEAMQQGDAAWLETGLRGRLRAWLVRSHTLPRFAKLARLTGLALPLWLVQTWIA
jgi:hypothetical protein